MQQQRAALANGARGARSSIPHTLTPDSLTCLFLGKVQLNHSDRVVAAEMGLEHKKLKWTKIVRDFYFTNDTFIQRNMNLNNPANLWALLQQGIDATTRDQYTTAIYGYLIRPGTSPLVCIIDSHAVKILKSSDIYLQKRTM